VIAFLPGYGGLNPQITQIPQSRDCPAALLCYAFLSILTAMKRRDVLEQLGLSSLKIKVGFVEGEFAPHDADRAAAWELYVESVTRTITQYLSPEHGDEKSALDSVHAILPLTRHRRHGASRGLNDVGGEMNSPEKERTTAD
jgi:hypothetical protein